MKGQLLRLERELRAICEEQPVGEAENCNKWHNIYVLGYWDDDTENDDEDEEAVDNPDAPAEAPYTAIR